MTYEAPTGVCMFAYNNEQIDYVQVAMLAAKYVKKYLNQPVCLITDEGSWDWLEQSQSEEDYESVFDYVVFTSDEMRDNSRAHKDSPYYEFKAQFNNSNKHKVYEYSPFEKTLLLDVDYFVRSDYLNHCWDTYEGVAMYLNAEDISGNLPHTDEQFLTINGIRMWWSTVIYFDRSDASQRFFGMWAHVAENYEYYQRVYLFPAHLFRTDYCVSIATHTLNGMTNGDAVNEIGAVPMLFSTQRDEFVEVKPGGWVMLSNDRVEEWKDVVVLTSNIDIHVMNKRAIGRQFHRLWESIDE